MVRRKQRALRRHQRHAVRPVLVVLPPLVEHDVALRLEPLARQRRQQVAHAIRFHPERQLERARRHHFPVVRAIGVRRSVEQRARLLQRLEEAAVVMLGPFEHQVLEQVREAGAPGRSFFEPTWYQRLTATIGTRWSSWTTTSRPLASVRLA
jgi:hypothetical protein